MSDYSPRAREFVSKKIRKLRGEGYPQDQAVAIAMDMARREGLKLPARENPQLQILMNGECKKCHKQFVREPQPYMGGLCVSCYDKSLGHERPVKRPDKFEHERRRRSNEDPALRDAKEGLREFHLNDELDGSNVKEWKTNDGSSRVITLYDGGQCPAVAWTHDECGSCKQHKLHIPAEDEDDQAVDVEWFGHRVQLSGARLGVDVRGRELCVVLGNHERLRRYEDEDGCLGYAPCCEYVPRLKRGKSGKGDFHYVHKFREISQPRLCWDDSIVGYRFKGGLYSVQEWVQD